MLDRGRQTEHFVELLFDEPGVDGTADEWRESGPLSAFAGDVEPFVGEIADARSEAEAEELA